MNKKELKLIDGYYRATNYISAAELYLMDNPLLRRKLQLKDIKPTIVGHWGTVPGQNFIYVHLNRMIIKNKLNMIYISGPGHGGNAMVANAYLEGTYTEVYPEIEENENGLRKLCKRFSFPGGISSHVAPETPGSINEGGELGYSLSHAFGAVLDNKDLIAACVVGDGEAETGPLAASWQLNKFLNPKKDGVVLPILHLNGFKIANPTILARISNKELISYFKGLGYLPIIVAGDTMEKLHKNMASALDDCIEEIKFIKDTWKDNSSRPIWPMIILKTEKGMTGPKVVDGKQIEGSFRAHQVPITMDGGEEKLHLLEKWLKSYKPEELFDKDGKLIPELKKLAPQKNYRMSANPNANGGLLLKELKVPNWEKYGVDIKKPGSINNKSMYVLGNFIRDIIKENQDNFLAFGPDEALSNRLNSVFEVTNRQWLGSKTNKDEFLATKGRVFDSVLSEHLCEGMLEGYLLTGRYGFMHSYEAFIRIVDSMASQHAKWLKTSKSLSWRKDIASLNYVLTSHCWQQDHNGFTHQDPGFLNHLVTKKADTVRMYLPPDTNCLLSCFSHCIQTKNYINVIVASKHERPDWLNVKEAKDHCEKGIGIWDWASTDKHLIPDIVMACCGDTPTIETLAAVDLLHTMIPNLKIRVVNVVDLFKLQSNLVHPHGLTDEEFNYIFTVNKHVIFSFHGYRDLIHQLTYKRNNKNIHVKGYKEEGTITTPFDMRVQNEIDRFHLIMSAIKYIDISDAQRSIINEWCTDKLKYHKYYIREYGKDMPEILNWTWKK